MSLADELLADLEEIEEDDELDEGAEDGIEEAMETSDTGQSKSIKAIAKLRDSDQLSNVLKQMEEFLENPRTRDSVFGPVELDPEYKLIVEANNLSAEIDNEINIIHKYCRDNYSKRFPELESLVPNALDYIQTVLALGNQLEANKIEELEFMPPATKMVVSVTASTTQGSILDQEEIELVIEACQMATDLTDAKIKIFQYVESRMSFIAPNLSVIVGASCAAKLMGAAGGLTVISKMPACNVLLIGAQKKTLTGFSSASVLPHTGLIFFSDIVQRIPPYVRRKAARLVSAKCSLAARVDSFHESLDGSLGKKLLEEIEKKFSKMLEVAPVKDVKALPRPDDAPRKKRGGRRVRKMKEKFAVTEMRRQANRTRFGEIGEDVYQTDLGFGIGTLDKDKTSGRVRTPAMDKKTQVSISKRLQRNLAAMSQVYGGKSTVHGLKSTVHGAVHGMRSTIRGGQSTVRGQVSGTASSVAFSAVQGLEIVNPHAAEKRSQEANAKYFSTQTGFLNVKKKK